MSQELDDSIENLKVIQGEIASLVGALQEAFKNSVEDFENMHKHVIKNTVACFLIIRLCAFKEELEEHYKKLSDALTGDIQAAIEKFDSLFAKYPISNLRNTILAHNNRKGWKGKDGLVSFDDRMALDIFNTPPEYDVFRTTALQIIYAINDLKKTD